eukprot:6164783-Amphidinium_carterae.1
MKLSPTKRIGKCTMPHDRITSNIQIGRYGLLNQSAIPMAEPPNSTWKMNPSVEVCLLYTSPSPRDRG